MANPHTYWRHTACGLLLAGAVQLSVAVPNAAADKAPAALGLTAEDTLKSLELQIELETQKKVNSKISAVEIARELNFETPVMPPTLSTDQVNSLVDDEVARALEEKHPASFFKEIKAEAERRFRMYKKGEEIEVLAMNRDNQYETKKGRLWDIKEDRIQVGDTTIVRKDISPKDVMHFYREEYNAKVDDYVRVQSRIYESKRSDYEAELRRRIGSELWSANGYIFWPKKNRWIPRYQYFYYMVDRKRSNLYGSVRPEIQLTAMRNAGWTFNPDFGTWEKIGEQIADTTAGNTAAADSSLLEKFKAFFIQKTKSTPQPVVPTVAPSQGETIDLWDDPDALWDEPGDTKPASGGTAPAPVAPSAAPAKNSKVESIFDEG